MDGAGPHDRPEYTAATNLGSVHFDGTGDYLASDNNDIGNFGTGDFTIEGWFWVPDRSALYTVADGRPTSLTSASGWSVAISTAGTLYVYTGGFHITGTAGAVTTKVWHHWALSRESGAMKLFLNGVQQGSTNSTARDFTANLFRVGASGTGGELFKGNQADVRVVKGTAVYTANFTPPTAPLSAITNTTFLLQNTDGGIIDKAQVSRQIKLVGNTKSSTAQYKFLTSSMYFDGNGDYIQLDSQNIANFGSMPFTAEGWFWVASLPGSGTIYSVVDARDSGGNATGWTLGIGASGNIYIYNAATTISGGSVSTSTWHHWAFTRSGTDQKLFLNGTQVGSTYTTSRNFTDNKFRIAGSHSGGELFTGYQSDVRISKGLARYTANFTPPTAALQG